MQSRLQSLIEAWANTIIGYFINLAVQLVVESGFGLCRPILPHSNARLPDQAVLERSFGLHLVVHHLGDLGCIGLGERLSGVVGFPCLGHPKCLNGRHAVVDHQL